MDGLINTLKFVLKMSADTVKFICSSVDYQNTHLTSSWQQPLLTSYKTTTSASYAPVLYCYKHLQTFYKQRQDKVILCNHAVGMNLSLNSIPDDMVHVFASFLSWSCCVTSDSSTDYIYIYMRPPLLNFPLLYQHLQLTPPLLPLCTVYPTLVDYPQPSFSTN